MASSSKSSSYIFYVFILKKTLIDWYVREQLLRESWLKFLDLWSRNSWCQRQDLRASAKFRGRLATKWNPPKFGTPQGEGLATAPSFTLIQKAEIGRHNWFYQSSSTIWVYISEDSREVTIWWQFTISLTFLKYYICVTKFLQSEILSFYIYKFL